MNRFDIASLLRFRPAQFLCERCCALLYDMNGRCAVCGVEYILTDDFPSFHDYFRKRHLTIQFRNLIEHSQRLALIARQMHDSNGGQLSSVYPPMRGLLASLQNAEQFVHFTTYGMSALLLGALKLTAQRIPVRGIVSGVKTEVMMREMTDYQDEAPNLSLRVFSSDDGYVPHQKLIVLDGLMAFKGSANMTDFGWRKAAHGHELIEVVTDVGEVIEMNNRFFSPVWAGDRAGERILMTIY